MKHYGIIVLLALLTPLSVCVGPVGMVRAWGSQTTESEQTTSSFQSSEAAVWLRREEAPWDQAEVVVAQRRPEQKQRASSCAAHALPGALPDSGHRLANGLNAPLRT